MPDGALARSVVPARAVWTSWIWYTAVVAAVPYGAHQIFTRLASNYIAEGLGGFVVEGVAALTILAICFSSAVYIALAKVPHGRIKSGEIENENGRLVWSFDIAEPRSKDITGILVDAKTGRIVAKQTESLADQAKEAAADRQNH